MTRLLVLGLDQDDALACAITDQLILAHRAVGSRIELVWPTAFVGLAMALAAVLVGIRTWRRLTTPTDEIGD